MSFLKIKDPAKRDAIVKEYLNLKKNIRTNLLSERTGGMEMQTDLSKFFKPMWLKVFGKGIKKQKEKELPSLSRVILTRY